jgi:hypothetical protein
MTTSFLLHPQRIEWRVALFQVHLWTGLILGIYVCAVGISGSIVVFEEELTRLSRPDLFRPGSQDEPVRYESLASTAADVKIRCLAYRFSEVLSHRERACFAVLRLAGNPDRKTESLDVVELLAGHAGLIPNGCGAVLLVNLAATGSVIWFFADWW